MALMPQSFAYILVLILFIYENFHLARPGQQRQQLLEEDLPNCTCSAPRSIRPHSPALCIAFKTSTYSRTKEDQMDCDGHPALAPILVVRSLNGALATLQTPKKASIGDIISAALSTLVWFIYTPNGPTRSSEYSPYDTIKHLPLLRPCPGTLCSVDISSLALEYEHSTS